MAYVLLKCVKENSKLRIKITSNGYNKNANCQFPKAIRKEGKTFRVPAHAVKVVQRGSDKFFYNINKSFIEELLVNANTDVKPEKIFTVSEECVICMSAACNMVMVPCGHLCMCTDCSNIFNDNKCPMCRSSIAIKINKNQLQ